jgi:hypothetical protein
MRFARNISVAALGAALLVAGAGLSVPAGAAPTFTTKVVANDKSTSEPGIDVAPDGTLYINGPAGLLSNVPGSASYVWRSRDGGASWTLTPADLRANLPGGGDSDISIDASGGLHMTDLWLGSATVSRSTDQGQTWLANPVQGVVVQDRQWIAAGSGSNVYHVTHQIPAGLVVSKSVDGGLTFPLHVVAATPLDQTGCVCPPGNLIAERGTGPLGTTDKVGVIYATSSGGVNFARSTNGGLTFTNTTVGPASTADTSTTFPAVASAGNGRLVATWLAVVNGASSVRFNSSNDWGATWGTPKTIVASGTPAYPWVAAQGSKVSVVLYESPDARATPDTVPASARFFESYLESTDGGSTFSALTTVDATPAKTGPVCTEGINCSSGRELGDFQQVAIDNAGHPVLSYIRVDASAPGGVDVMFAKGT